MPSKPTGIEDRGYDLSPGASALHGALNGAYDAGHSGYIAEISETPWPSPSLKLSVTNRCNLSCTYCYDADNQPPHVPKADMSVSMVEDIFRRYPNPTSIFVLGGEPFLNPQAVHAILRGTESRIGISTNGKVMNRNVEDLCAAIVDRADRGMTTALQVSAEDGGRSTERGTGDNEARLLRFHELCGDHVKYKFTLTPEDTTDIAAIAQWYWDRNLLLQMDFVDTGHRMNFVPDALPIDDAAVFAFMTDALQSAFETWQATGHNPSAVLRIKTLFSALMPRAIVQFLTKRPTHSACGVMGHSIYIGPSGNQSPCHRWREHKHNNFDAGGEQTTESVRAFHASVGSKAGRYCETCQWRGGCGGVCPAVMVNYGHDALEARCRFKGAQQDAVFAFLTDPANQRCGDFGDFLEAVLELSPYQFTRRKKSA